MTANSRRRLAQIEQQTDANKLARVGYEYFRRITPIDSGQARKNTRLVNNEIRAEYPYAVRLDQGWSRQARQGMVKPTIKYLTDYIRRTLGR